MKAIKSIMKAIAFTYFASRESFKENQRATVHESKKGLCCQLTWLQSQACK